jgi:hypothetical protein
MMRTWTSVCSRALLVVLASIVALPMAIAQPTTDQDREPAKGSTKGRVTDQGRPIYLSLVDDPPDGTGSSDGASGAGASGTGASGTGSSGAGASGTGASGTGSSGAASGAGASGTGTGSSTSGAGSSASGAGSSASGAAMGSGSATGSATGSAAGSGSATGSATGSAAGSGSATGSATGSAAGSSSATGSGAGAGSGSAGPTIIQLPTDVAAPEVNASAFPTAVRLGGRFTLIVTATFGAGVEVNLKEPFDLGPAFEVRKRVSEDRPRGDGKTTREWQIDVLAWELGDLRLVGIPVTYTVNGALGQIDTNTVRIRVDGVLGDQVDDPKALRDLQPPTALITDDYFWLLVGGGVLWVIAVVALYLYLRSRRRARIHVLTGGVVARPRKMDMTSEKALSALLAIEKSRVLADDEKRRDGYAQMVEVIREYLGARYRVATLDLTSSELVRKLGKIAPEEERMLVEEWLEACDLVKYGGFATSSDEAQGVLDDARALVVTTSQPKVASVPVVPVVNSGPSDRPPRAEASA